MFYRSDAARALERQSSPLVAAVMLFFALVFEILPWNEFAWRIKPELPALVLLYEVVTGARYIGYAVALAAGLLLDVGQQTAFGEHALAYVLVVFLAGRMRHRFTLIGVGAQALHVFLILSLAQLTLFGLSALQTESSALQWRHFYGAGAGALLWFALPFLISRLRAWFGGGPRG